MEFRKRLELWRTGFLVHASFTDKTKRMTSKLSSKNATISYVTELGNQLHFHAWKGWDTASSGSVWKSLNLLQSKDDDGKEGFKLAWGGPEKILSLKSMFTINSRLIPIEVKVRLLSKEDRDSIWWHVEDLKILHSDGSVNQEVLGRLNVQYGKETPLTVICGNTDRYLGMTIVYIADGKE